MQRKYIFITGGVISSLGKGTIASSTGRILKDRGYQVTNVKCEMYVNIDSGTIRPTEHGEVFVTDDGLEADQDLGNYERFTENAMGRANFMTTGQIYETVIHKERNLEYEGEDVEVVPHVPQEIIRRIKAAGDANAAEIVIIELGGTVGEYQIILFLEAARMLQRELPADVVNVHVSYMPIPKSVGEMKTKPAQYSVRTLNAAGIQPDLLIGRSEQPIDEKRKEKLAWAVGVKKENVLSSPDCDTTYRVPLILEEQGYSDRLIETMGMDTRNGSMDAWKAFVARIDATKETEPINIGIVGKYFETGEFTLEDSYLSVIQAVKHAAWSQGRRAAIQWLSSENYEKNPDALADLENYGGVIIPGGYGARGTEGKIAAIRFLRENNIPFLGLCYGLQMAVIEYARNVLGLADAQTTEIDPKTKHPIIFELEQTKAVLAGTKGFGGTQRLGAYPCVLKEGTKVRAAYGVERISERHRHRYEVNDAYRAQLEAAGMTIAGVNPNLGLVEVIELSHHPFFIGTQFHPEFMSRPLTPHPLFKAFFTAATHRA